MATNSRLFEPLKVGNMLLKHRVVMAPLTRFRSDDDHVPILPLVKDYYAQRASVPGTLLITEATFINPQASGYDSVPGLWTQGQLKAWKEVTKAVHEKGSFIYCQLWALGRAATENILEKKGLQVVSSSAVPIDDKRTTPREMSEAEILEFIKAYADAAKNAVEVAGFDGVEIHGANGYLVDQFTQDTCNKRTDRWGGSIENRARFGLEVAKAVTAAVGPSRVGIRLSPFSPFQGMRMADPIPQFSYLVKGLQELSLSYLHLVESRIQGPVDADPSGDLGFAIDIWRTTSPVLIAGGFTAETAVEKVDKDFPDKDVAIVFGRHFISNPDLPFRIQTGIPFNKYERKTFYKARSPEGYLDYPFSKEWDKFSSML
jgi:NADPH2 dehydrogenase